MDEEENGFWILKEMIGKTVVFNKDDGEYIDFQEIK
mgnify:CR=1 FL=1